MEDPRPDGFPLEYYQKLCNLLLPHLLSMYKEAIALGRFPKDLDLATVVVLHNKGIPRSTVPPIG